MGAFDRAVLMRNALVVAGRGHPVMGAQFLIAMREIGLGIRIEAAEGRRQAVAAMIERRAADRPQRVLQAFRQSDEALAAKDDMGVLEARPDEPEVIEQMIERLTGDRHAELAHVGKIRKPQPAGFMGLAEDHLLFLTVNGSPCSDAPLKRAANAFGQLRMPPQHLVIPRPPGSRE